MPLLAAANRDPVRFPDPARFDIGRAGNKSQLGFGMGVHYCPGTVLSRPASATLFRELARRYRTLWGEPTTCWSTSQASAYAVRND